MIIHTSKKSKKIYSYSILLIAFFCFFIGFLFSRLGLGTYLRYPISYIRLINDNLSPIHDYKMEHIYLDINFKDFDKKINERQNFINQGFIGNGLPNDYVPIKIRHKENNFKAKLRFKGMMLDHISHPQKWSYKIRVKEGKTIFGLSEFSIQRPGTKNGIGEWLFMKLMNENDIIAPYYEFIKVTQNGKYLGVYAIEGRFNQDLRSNKKLRDGPFIKFDPKLWVQSKNNLDRVTNSMKNSDWSTYSDPINAYELNRGFKDQNFKNKIERGVNLFENFRNQTQNIKHTFNQKKLAKYFALCDITGSVHASQHSSIKAYYNPDSDLLEPVAWDADGFMRIADGDGYTSFILAEEPSSKYSKSYRNRRYEHRMLYLLEDEDFYKEYINQLDSLNNTQTVEKFIIKNQSIIKTINHNLHFTEGLKSYQKTLDIIQKNQKYVKGTLNPSKGIHAFFHNRTNKGLNVSIANIQYLPIELISVQSANDTFFINENRKIGRRSFDLPPDYELYFFRNSKIDKPISLNLSDLKINYKIIGMRDTITSVVFPFSNIDDISNEEYVLKKPSNNHDFNFLITNENEKTIRLKVGEWDITKSVILPEGYEIIASENTTLNLLNESMIISNSPLKFYGSNDKPILITSTDSTGKGLYILKTSRSTFKNVVFNNLDSPSFGNWSLSGSVSFYKAPVRFEKCIFSNNRSEDALNTIKSKFEIVKCHFQNIYSDAFDADFCNGSLSSSSFKNIGNDAIDVSGTFCSLEKIKIHNANDKAISIGEESKALLDSIQISNSEICLASKDLSTIEGNNIVIYDSKIGISAFQKKAEFGPGAVYLSNYRTQNVFEEFLIEDGSIVEVNESIIDTDIKNVKNLLYGNLHGKATKK